MKKNQEQRGISQVLQGMRIFFWLVFSLVFVLFVTSCIGLDEGTKSSGGDIEVGGTEGSRKESGETEEAKKVSLPSIDFLSAPEVARYFTAFSDEAEVYLPPQAAVKNLPPDGDPKIQVALSRLNEYREAADLTPYAYSEELTLAARAHAHYGIVNCEKGNPYQGHYERKELPAYSEIGNKAAETSGISYSGDPLAGLYGLIAGPYHRNQFLSPYDAYAGAGSESRMEGRCGTTLFVTRGDPTLDGETYRKVDRPRFILFPPPEFSSTPTSFVNENPDPRPGFEEMDYRKVPVTGFPITISLSHEDTRNYNGTKARVMEQGGDEIAVWITDPVNPSHNRGPSIYAEGETHDDAFSRNFNMVFIMPKEPLKPGTIYNVEAECIIAGEKHSLSWWFKTRPAKVWEVKARPDPRNPWEELQTALSWAKPGDTVRLDPGEYSLEKTLHLSNIRIIGAGPGVSKIRSSREIDGPPLVLSNSVIAADLEVITGGSAFYVRTGASLLLSNVAISGGNGAKSSIYAEEDSVLALSGVDGRGFDTYYFIYAKEGEDKPLLLMDGEMGIFGDFRAVYGEAEVVNVP